MIGSVKCGQNKIYWPRFLNKQKYLGFIHPITLHHMTKPDKNNFKKKYSTGKF